MKFPAQMLFNFIVVLLVTVPSMIVIRLIERGAERIRGGRLPRWRRLLIPLPIVFFLAANLDAVLSLIAYLEAHRYAIPARYSGNEAWSTDRFAYAGLVSATLLPFFLASRPFKHVGFVLRVWIGHFVWLMFPFCPLMLATGMPLQN